MTDKESRLSLRLWSLLVLLLFCLPAFAQYNGNVQGVVSDPAGAAINGASVQLRNADTGVTAAVTTSGSGNYRFNSLPPGNYVLTAEAKGFRKAESSFTLSTDETRGINVAMPLAATSQTVTVEVAAPVVDTDDSRLETTLSSNTVRDLPEANRNLWDIMAVQPGVVGTGTRATGESPGGFADNFGTQTPQISANGRSYTGNLVMVDGLNVTSPVQNGNIILAPIPDAVQEVSLQTNSWDGEDNLGSSILIQVTTKSGTNQFHGTGSLFFTNQDLQATPYFTAANAFLPFARKDLVGTLGGPIRKGKTFFFADFEKLWATTAGTASGTQYYEDPAFVAWAQANFPGTVGTQVLAGWPASRLIGSPYQTAQQALNGNCGTTTPLTPPCDLNMIDAGSFAASPYYNALQYNFRVDHYFTQNDRLYLSYYNDSFDQQQLSARPRLDALDIMRNRYGQIDFTHTFNSNVLLEGGLGFASVGGANGQDANLAVPDISVSATTTSGSLVGFPVGGGWGPGEYRGPNYNWRAVLSWVHGKHTLRFGYDGDHAIEHGDFTPYNVRPDFTFNNLLDLVQDNVQTETVYAYNPLTGGPGSVIYGGQTNPFGFFVQDDWKAKPNLSLTLSLRWDDLTNHKAWGNNGFQFSTLILAPAGNFNTQVANASVGIVPQVFTNDMKNLFSPRIGFSWDPTKRGKWAVRGGIGVYHDWVVLGQSVDQTRNNPPGVISQTFLGGVDNYQGTAYPLSNYFAIAPSGSYPWNFPLPPIPAGSLNSHGGLTGATPSVDALNQSMVAPLAVNYVIGVEHQLVGSLVAGANYSGSKSYDGLNGENVNYFPGGATYSVVQTANGPEVVESVGTLNPYFGPITYVSNQNASTYNSMILFLRGKAGHRGAFQGSYTLSHARDYPEANTRFDQDTSPFDLNIPQPSSYFSYYGDADFDVRQRFSFSGSYTLPGYGNGVMKVLTGGWEASSIIAIQTGTPFWVTDNRQGDIMCSDNGTLDASAVACPLGSPTALQPVQGVSPSLTNPNGYALAPNSGDYNLDGTVYDVPNLPTQNFTGSHGKSAYINGLFTASDFPAPAIGTEGNEPRNIYRNPGMFQWDASVLKNNHLPWLGEEGNLQLRFDFINLFNHTNLGPVDPNMGDPGFGKVGTVLPARQLQFGLRVAF